MTQKKAPEFFRCPDYSFLRALSSHIILLFLLVEVGGIEPPSGKGRRKASPITVSLSFSHIHKSETKNKCARYFYSTNISPKTSQMKDVRPGLVTPYSPPPGGG